MIFVTIGVLDLGMTEHWEALARRAGAFARYSPGAPLVDKVTDALFEHEAITAIESCSPESGFMTQLWTGRRMTVDLLIDVGAGNSLRFTLAALSARCHAWLRDKLHRLHRINWPLRPKRRNVATTES